MRKNEAAEHIRGSRFIASLRRVYGIAVNGLEASVFFLTRPSHYEESGAFRGTIGSLASHGVFTAGVIGILLISFYLSAHVIMAGDHLVWNYQPDMQGRVAVLDKLLVFLLGGISILFHRLGYAREWGRAYMAGILIFASFAFLMDDVARNDLEDSTTYLPLVMLTAAGMMPYRAEQMLAFCLTITGLYVVISLLNPPPGSVEWHLTVIRRAITLIVFSLLCAGISMLLYESRYREHSARMRTEATLRELRKTQVALVDAHTARLDAAERLADHLHLENERKTAELGHARRLQLAMLPESIPEHKGVEIAANSETATEVGGDYYDFNVDQNGVLTVVIGDATGHGVAAGMMVTVVKSLWNAFAQDGDLEAFITRSDDSIRRMRMPGLYMALAVVRLDENHLEYIGAGMPPALVYRAATGRIDQISLSGIPLGSPRKMTPRMRSEQLNRGDTLLLMSDGLPESFDGAGRMLGYESMAALFREVATAPPETIIAHLQQKGRDWGGDQPLRDDMTFVALRITANVAAAAHHAAA